MQFLKAFNWLCLFGTSVLAQPSKGITTDASVLPTAVTTTIAARPMFPAEKQKFFYKWLTSSTRVEASPTATSKSEYREPLKSLPTRASGFPIKPFPTLHSNGNVDISDLPDCVLGCSENAWAFTDCDEESKDCVCVDNQFQKILYHCLNSICEPEKLSYAVKFITEECSPYLPIDEEGETILFHDIKVHQQEELHQLYGRNNLGSGVVSGARPNGPTASPFPQEVNEGFNVEVVITTIVTEYVGGALYPRATAELEGKGASEGNNAHGHRHLRRTKRHHI